MKSVQQQSKRQIDFDTVSVPKGMAISEDNWSATPQSVRREIVRAHFELHNGLAIAKDRRVGRGKNDPNGFYGLLQQERALERLVADGKDLKAVQVEVNRLRKTLEGDERLLSDIDAVNERFGPLAASAGTTLVDALEKYTALEHDLGAAAAQWKNQGNAGPLLDFMIRVADYSGQNGVEVVHGLLRDAMTEERAA